MKPKVHTLASGVLVTCLLVVFISKQSFGQDLALREVSEPDDLPVSVEVTSETPENVEEIKHLQKNMIGDQGQIFWNKSLPVYISLLTSPDSKEGMVIKTNPEGTTEPYYFDTEGINWIRTKWQVDPETKETIYPKQEVLWPVVVDGMAPKTKASFTASGKFTRSGVTYYSGDVKVELTATDATSGVESIFYTLGNGYATYSKPFSLEQEKDWELKFYAVDNVGNYEIPSADNSTVLNFVVDKTAPKTQFETEGPRSMNILSHKSSISLSSEDSQSGVRSTQYKLSEDQPRKYSQPISLSSLKDGFHQLEYSAVDNVTNQEESNVFVFYLDRIAPEISVNVKGDQFQSETGIVFVSQRSQLELKATDNQAGVNKVHYKVDNDTYSIFNDPINTDLKQGKHSLNYYGNDKVENVSAAASFNYTIDADSPQISYKVSGAQYVRHDTLFVRSNSMFKIISKDEGYYQSGVKSINYTVGNQSEMSYDSEFSIEQDGLTALSISSLDYVNNQADFNQVVFVDNEAPGITHTFSVDKIGKKTVRDKEYIIYPYDAKIYLAAKDEHVGSQNIFYQIDDGPEKEYVSPLSGFKEGSNVELKVRATDLLGNESTTTIVFSTE